MITEEVRGWLEMLVGAAISLYVANRGSRGVFANLRSRGEGLMGAMLMAIGVQTHLERLNADTPFFHWLPLGLGVLGLALIVAGKVGEPRVQSDDEESEREDLASGQAAELRAPRERVPSARPSIPADRVRPPR